MGAFVVSGLFHDVGMWGTLEREWSSALLADSFSSWASVPPWSMDSSWRPGIVSAGFWGMGVVYGVVDWLGHYDY